VNTENRLVEQKQQAATAYNRCTVRTEREDEYYRPSTIVTLIKFYSW